ncbi:MAG TPA: ABC transporter permease [Thermoanaerobaculia bacterium]|nr:ABC transporter permease [Thermoanaerobaculia bacterium]
MRKLVGRDLTARFMGSTLGLAWAVLQPLALVALYWFVFTTMFTTRVGGGGAHYAEFLVAGLLPWFAFNEGLIRSTTAMLDNAPLVRKLPLDFDVLVLVPNLSALIFECIGLAIFVAFLTWRGNFPGSIWLLPVALAIQFTLQAGIGLFLAATQVFFRDLTHIVGFVLSIVFYLSPILYPVGGRFEKFFAWNPLTPLLGLYRRALLSGIPEAGAAAALPEPRSIVLVTVVALAVFAVGRTVMHRSHGDLVDLI